MATRERIELRVEKGALVPNTQQAASLLRANGYKIGDVVMADICKERNPRFMRLAHAIGRLCVENIDAFIGVDSHTVLKRIQLESGTACDEQVAHLPDGTQFLIRQPKSMAFDKMCENEFNSLVIGLCTWISMRYMPTLTPDKVRVLAEAMID